MTVQLSAEEQLKFSNIMFQDEGRQFQQIQNLTPLQKSKLKSMYAQKIAYDVANQQAKSLRETRMRQSQYNRSSAPGIISTLCCCFMPEQNRDRFDITSSLFLKRLLSTLVFFKGGFLQIGDGKPQLYGYLWLSICYVIILGVASNLNNYFVSPVSTFSSVLMLRACLLSAIFLIVQPFIYKAVTKCLSGSIQTIQSMMLCGYSTSLYFIPTILCLLPSLYWHVGMLALAVVVRAVFLWRNYSDKIPSKSVVFFGVALAIQAFYGLIVLRVMFSKNSGYGFNSGANRVFKHYQMERVFQI